MFKRTFHIIIAFVSIGMLVSCTISNPVIRFGVNSLARPDASAMKHYLIMPGSKELEANELQFLEYADYADKVLKKRGFMKVKTLDDADIVIFLSYGVGDPQTYNYSYSLPTWGVTGVSSTTTSGTVNTFGNTSTYSGTTRYTPNYGVTGYRQETVSGTVYKRFIAMDAYDVAIYKQEKKMKQVWKTNVISTGNSSDLRYIFPMMAVAMKPYIGKNTRRMISLIADLDDPEFKELTDKK
jgi:hypothetical protein